MKNGKLVYQNAWGKVNSYNPDGTPKTDSPAVTNDTLYDLASNTKIDVYKRQEWCSPAVRR